MIIIRLSCHLWIIFIQSFKLDIERSLCSMRKYRSGIFSRKKLELVWLDFLKKKLFLSRIARIAFTIVVSSRCEFSCAKKKRKEERKSNEIVSHRRRYVPIIVDNRLWRKLILRILKSILLLHVSQKFRGYERCKARLFRDGRQVSLSGTKLINLHAILSTFHSNRYRRSILICKIIVDG